MHVIQMICYPKKPSSCFNVKGSACLIDTPIPGCQLCHSHVKSFSEFMKTSIFNIQKVHISWTPSSRMYRKIPEQIWYRVFGGYGELSTCNNSTLFCIYHLVSLCHYYKSMKNRRSAKFRIGSVVIECPKLRCKMTRVFTRQKGYTIRHNISYRIYK